jgi:hypothetical protein
MCQAEGAVQAGEPMTACDEDVPARAAQILLVTPQRHEPAAGTQFTFLLPFSLQ